ncbi:sugar kinase [Pedococcus sp.]|uniref:sugar kinase n=1 Tax=Pedococcus sp. TaxID=2860345 RepID=UPI002E0D65EC|nr:sugar kinase [Pedococcus sp.]
MNEATLDLATVGEVMGLLLAPPGQTLDRAARLRASYAGAESTVAVGLARLGHRVHLTTRLGQDSFGARIRRELRAEGVEVSAAADPVRPTGILLRDASVVHPVTVEYHRVGSAASGLTPDALDPAKIGGARLLHITGITAALSPSGFETIVHAAGIARAAAVPVCLDPNVRLRLASPERWAVILERLSRLADIVLTGADDAAVVTDEDPAAWFLDRGARIVVVKDGARGAREVGPQGRHQQPALGTVLADPVGAGDAFAAGWLSGYLRGEAPPERLRRAAVTAACAISVPGDVDGLPDGATLQRVLDEHADVAR